MAEPSVLVLTYHSIGDDPGPTSIPAPVFRMQMDELVRAGYRALDVQGFIDWRLGRDEAPGRRVLITFDDGFADFAKSAHPILKAHSLASLMFIPTGRVGGVEQWAGANDPPRPLLTWKQIIALSQKGVEFGAHTIHHPDLTALPADERMAEIEGSGRMLAEQLGKRTRAFAAPYGRVNKTVLADIARHYELAFGVQFDRAGIHCDPVNIPRIEMHYFRDQMRWRDFLTGGEAYFQTRRLLRGVRNLIAQGAAHG